MKQLYAYRFIPVKYYTVTGLCRQVNSQNHWCAATHLEDSCSAHSTFLVRLLWEPLLWDHREPRCDALRLFRLQFIRRWRKWLGRRSHRARWRWERFARFLIRYPLPQAMIRHATPVT
jgi:hypothetical protein